MFSECDNMIPRGVLWVVGVFFPDFIVAAYYAENVSRS